MMVSTDQLNVGDTVVGYITGERMKVVKIGTSGGEPRYVVHLEREDQRRPTRVSANSWREWKTDDEG